LIKKCQNDFKLRQNELDLTTKYLAIKDEKDLQGTPVSMIIELYFKSLLPLWKEFRAKQKEIEQSVYNVSDIDVKNRPVPNKEEVINRLVNEYFQVASPNLQKLRSELFESIARIADGINAEKPWPCESITKFLQWCICIVKKFWIFFPLLISVGLFLVFHHQWLCSLISPMFHHPHP